MKYKIIQLYRDLRCKFNFHHWEVVRAGVDYAWYECQWCWETELRTKQ